MPRIKEKIRSQNTEKKNIDEMIKTENIRPTQGEQEKAAAVIAKISDQFSEQLIDQDITDIQSDIIKAIEEQCAALDISYEHQKRIEKTVLMTVLGNGPIETFLQDPEVTEIVVQRYDNIVIQKVGQPKVNVDVTFNSEEHLQTIIKRIVQKTGRQINITSPIVDTRLPDGSRVNAVIPPVSPDGATLDIRKFTNTALSGSDYLKIGSLSREMLYFLERCVRGKITIIVSGGTGSGKTTLLNMLSGFIPSNELIVTIEDTLELQLQQPNVRRREVRRSQTAGMLDVTQTVLVKNALREYPDRIILGEIRDGSIVDFVSAASTGHEGSLSTIHANNPKNLCDTRIPILYTMCKDADFTEKSIALQIAEAVQIIVQIKRCRDEKRRITHISQVCGVNSNDKVIVKDIFIYDSEQDCYLHTGYIPRQIIQSIKEHGLEFDERIFDDAEKKGGRE